jgi:hypothetical protein
VSASFSIEQKLCLAAAVASDVDTLSANFLLEDIVMVI